jgi:chromosome segregation ATPase
MADEKKKVSALIPLRLLTALEDKGYTNQTEAIIKGLEHLLTEDKGKIREDIEKIEGDNKKLREDNEKIREDIEKIREDAQRQIKNMEEKLKAAPDLGEFSEMRATLKEIQDHNETLKRELEKAERDKEDLKAVYNNYFLQVQTLINQKAIEAPGAKKLWYKFW